MTHPLWIAHNPSVRDHKKNREQFNGEEPAWGESLQDHNLKQGIPLPNVGDTIDLRMGVVTVESRRLNCPETNDAGEPVTSWYWTVLVR